MEKKKFDIDDLLGEDYIEDEEEYGYEDYEEYIEDDIYGDMAFIFLFRFTVHNNPSVTGRN